MKFLGTFVIIFGLGTVISTTLNYLMWWNLKNTPGPLPHAEQQLVEHAGHGYFTLSLVVGIGIVAFGIILFKKKNSKI